jgi:hypothetical protein
MNKDIPPPFTTPPEGGTSYKRDVIYTIEESPRTVEIIKPPTSEVFTLSRPVDAKSSMVVVLNGHEVRVLTSPEGIPKDQTEEEYRGTALHPSQPFPPPPIIERYSVSTQYIM